MLGTDKPDSGDRDQIGGTFHFDFLWKSLSRNIPHAKERAATLVKLQRSDGIWDPNNPWWLTFDAVYMLGRTLPDLPSPKTNEVYAAIRSAVDALATRALSSECRTQDFVNAWMGVHTMTGAISFFAYAQQVLGIHEIVTDKPLRLVLDQRPYI